MIARPTQVAIQVGRRQLGLDDALYREILQRLAGVTSSKDLDQVGADRVLAEFRAKGFEPASKGPRRGTASQPMARRARAMWLNLWNLDELESSAEAALTAFSKGITGKDDMRFCTGPELNKVIEALKAWSTRIGLSTKGSPLDIRRNLVREQWARLYRAGWAKVGGDNGLLGFSRKNWCTPNDRPLDQFEAEHLDKLAALLGPIVRSQRVGRRHQ